MTSEGHRQGYVEQGFTTLRPRRRAPRRISKWCAHSHGVGAKLQLASIRHGYDTRSRCRLARDLEKYNLEYLNNRCIQLDRRISRFAHRAQDALGLNESCRSSKS